jgi:hypothetical protein
LNCLFKEKRAKKDYFLQWKGCFKFGKENFTWIEGISYVARINKQVVKW